ncbi:MAG TPA: M56 family metallopeptidase, partial [Niastella sp.]
SSHLRYQLLCGILILFIALTGYTFYRQLNIAHGVQTVVSGSNGVGSTAIVQTQQTETTGITGYARFVNALNAASGWIVAVWMLCFVFKSIKLSRELLYIRQVRRKGVIEMEGAWKNRIVECCKQLGIRRVVQVFESKLVNVPVTIGHLKPVILLPVGMILQLPAAQVESILYHELAHILRRDYLINILVSIVESIFFFNPAVWWLCDLIREERETCCDDIVLANIPQKRSYLEALMAFQSYESQAGRYAMGLSLRPPQLMNRLRRMVNQENQRLNTGEKIVLLLGLLLFALFVFVPKVNSEVRHSAIFIKKQIQAIVTNHSEPEPVAATTNRPAIKPTAQRRTAIVASSIIPPSQKDTIFKIASIWFKNNNADTANMEMQVVDDQGNHYQLKVVDGGLVALNINNSTIADEDLPHYDGLLRRIQQAWAARRQEKKANGIARRAMAEERASQQALADSTNRKKEKKKHRLTEEAATEIGVKTKKREHVPAVPDTAIGTKGVAHKKKHKPIDISRDQQRVRGVLSVLVSENVVTDESNVDWFGLTETELVVNGIKQPDALHQKLKTLSGVKPHFGLYYGPVKIYGSGVYLDKKDL